ncbi:MAG: hypothetical protein ACYSTF_05905 [Planctomycetota bacterium]|jgi:hypothetical protein
METRHNNNPDSFREVMTEAEVVEFLRIPEISKAKDHRNVVANLKRMRDLPCLHISKQPLYLRESVLGWVREQIEKEQNR